MGSSDFHGSPSGPADCGPVRSLRQRVPRVRFSKIPNIDEERLDGELILLHPLSLQVKVLNETAAVLWDALEAFPTADALVAIVSEARPEIPTDEVWAMVRGFLDELVTAELVERSEHGY